MGAKPPGLFWRGGGGCHSLVSTISSSSSQRSKVGGSQRPLAMPTRMAAQAACVCVWPASKGMPGGAARAGRVGPTCMHVGERSEDAAALDAQTRKAGAAGQSHGGRAVGGGAGTFCDGSRAARSRARGVVRPRDIRRSTDRPESRAGGECAGGTRRRSRSELWWASAGTLRSLVRRAAGTAGFNNERLGD